MIELEVDELRIAGALFVVAGSDDWSMLMSDIEVGRRYAHEVSDPASWNEWIGSLWIARGATNVTPNRTGYAVVTVRNSEFEVDTANGTESRWRSEDPSHPFFMPRQLGEIASLAVIRRYLWLRGAEGQFELATIKADLENPDEAKSDRWRDAITHGEAVQAGRETEDLYSRLSHQGAHPVG